MVQYVTHSPQAESQKAMRGNLSKIFDQTNQFAIEQQQYERNRGRLQQALGEVEQSAKNPQGTPLQTSLSFLNAMAGIPGSERYTAQVLPQILQQAQAEKIYGNKSGGSASFGGQGSPQAPGQQMPQQDFAQGNQNITGPSPTGQQGPLPQERQYPTGGVLPEVIPTEEIDQEAKNAALISGDPNRYSSRMSELQNYNQLAQQAQDIASKKAASFGIPPQEIPEFLKLGKRYGYLRNSDDWAEKTLKDWKVYKSDKEKLQNAFVPGFFTGLVSSAKSREDTLKKLNPVVRDLVDKGFEPETRAQLAQQGLSPTEVEEQINPLSSKAQAALSGVAKYSADMGEDLDVKRKDGKTFRDIINKDLVKYFENNIDEKTPLSVLRHKLWADKGVPWESIGPAIREAVANKKINLTPAQQTEMVEVETQPPRNSLSEIFKDWWRPIEFIKGSK